MVHSDLPKSNVSTRITRRRKYLNVIYFIDSDKTRSFKLPLSVAYSFLAGGVFLALWLFTSITFLFLDQKTIHANKTHIQNLLGVIFQYQTRYDEIFEIAYEGLSGTTTAQSEKSAPPVAKQEKQPAAPTPATIELPDEDAIPKPAAVLADKSQAEPAVPAEEPVTEGAEAFAVQVENMKEHLYDDELQVSFDIRNMHGTQKASGFIWGVAKIEKDDGQTAFLTSPTSVMVDNNGAVKNLNQAYKFSIKYYKSKTLTFALPPVKGVVKEISVYVSDNGGQDQKGERLAVDIAVSGKPATPASAPAPTPDIPVKIDTPTSDAQPGSGAPGESLNDGE